MNPDSAIVMHKFGFKQRSSFSSGRIFIFVTDSMQSQATKHNTTLLMVKPVWQFISEKGKTRLAFTLLILLAVMPLFGNLGNLPIRQWDEARLSVNAYEMMKSGNLLVTTYQNMPDLWNTKPPFLIWQQALLMRWLDEPELAMRIPSAVAGFLTIVLVFVFVARRFGDYRFAFVAGLILLTSAGYVNLHATRTGDYDAMLVLFTTLSALALWLYTDDGKPAYLYLVFISLALGVLTKSVSALLFLPGMFFYLIYSRKLLALLKNKHFYMGLLCFIIPVGLYYSLREWAAPGYINAVMENELLGRYMNVVENHKETTWYYYHNLVNSRFKPYHWLIPAGMILPFFTGNKRLIRLVVFLSLLLVSYFAVITLGETKLHWYDLPMYPLLAITAAAGIYSLLLLFDKIPFPPALQFLGLVVPFVVLLLLFFKPVRQTIDRNYKPKEMPWDKHQYTLAYYLRDGLKGKQDLSNTYVLFEGYNTGLMVYIHKMADKGITTSYKYYKTLKAGDQVVTYQQPIMDFLEQQFTLEVVHSQNEITTYKLIQAK